MRLLKSETAKDDIAGNIVLQKMMNFVIANPENEEFGMKFFLFENVN